MTGTAFGNEIDDGIAANVGEPPAGCRSDDLRSLLNTIVDQIAEADRRHSDTLQQLQDRLAGLDRETKAIKPRIPGQYAAAFERIEAGVSELASRIADAAEHQQIAHEPRPLATHERATEPASKSMPIYGESLAFEGGPAPLRAPGEPCSVRNLEGIDPFDIIESIPPGNSDPWDRNAADALTEILEDETPDFDVNSYALPPVQPEAPQSQAKPEVVSAALESGADKVWLAERFAEIARRIEESLEDIRPDQGFFALNQRVDQFEQNLSAAIESIAYRGDVDGMHQIEARVNELATQLETAHNQLQRLDEIEHQLASIAVKLEDVHHAATASMELDDAAPSQPNVDYDAVARTAAEKVAAELVRMKASDAASGDASMLGDMLRNFIAESRQGDENTAALLDTLQQAMIRLLDRADGMEIAAIQAQNPAFGQHQAASEQHAMRSQYAGQSHAPMPFSNDLIDSPVAAIAAAPPHRDSAADDIEAGHHEHAAEKIRQEFIAEARRAKMRLAAEADAPPGNEAAEEEEPAAPLSPNSVAALRAKPRETTVAPDPEEAKKAAKAAKTAKASKASASGTSRIRLIGLATLLALGGYWATSNLLQDTGTPPAPASAKASHAENPASGQSMQPGASSEQAGEGASAVTGSGAAGHKIPEGTRGDITTDEFAVGTTSVPLYGVAVDTQQPITAAGLERAHRQQVMAAVSGRLGEAASQNGAATAMPASLRPDSSDAIPPPESSDADHAGPTPLSGMSKSSPLDLPPATVGPLSLRLAAANGDPSAEFEVGARLAEGSGTEQTFEEAAKWYRRAASKGLAQAQYRLGTLYERGLGLPKDKARAEDWYRRAADQGNIKAMHNLAVLRANATAGSPDYMTAALWFEKAAEHGLADSQFNLAVLKENGLGVPQDMVSAYKWLALAAKSGDKEALRRRDILKGKLTAAQLSDAEKRVTAFRVKRPDPNVNDAFRAGEAWKKNPGNGISG
jgi:localization factor PodJL